MQRPIISVLITSFFFSSCAVATTQPSPGRSASAAVDDTLITEASIRSHMTFLASDALNGRGSGTRDEWIAAEYIGAQLQRIGLEPLADDGGFVQRIEVD